jgi:hypothetical protein
MTKPSNRVCPIVVGAAMYQFTSHALCFQFCGTFATHFAPQQFEITIEGGCEVITHDISCTLDLYHDWVILQLDVANAFNSVSKGVIFQKLCTTSEDNIQLIPLVHAFNAFESPMFYNHHNREGDVIVSPLTMGARQGDFLRGALFALTHFRALHFTSNHFLSCLLPSIVDNIHIIGPHSIVSCAYEHF